jgi:glycosyltransferase involved in cell wall biosynthesis
VTAVAAVTPFKGYHHLLKAARLVNAEMPQSKPLFLCVGALFDENYVAYLERQIRENHLDNVHFVGWQQNPFPFYRLADVVVLPTIEREQLNIGDQVIDVRSGEGLPRSILEAMYCARPTVATAVAGTAEQIIDGDTGYLVPAGDPEALAQALIKVLRSSADSRREMGARAAQRVCEKFSTTNAVRQTAQLYRELLGKNARAVEPAAVMTTEQS